ncbi:MAG: winged helix-turn-helix transcriptional regulator [Thermoplasmatota archaeon]|jgi:DNA-binding Lrp family transcriptional regulator
MVKQNAKKKTDILIKDDEQKILYELLKDSSQSINTLAKKLKFSRQKVWRIIRHLKWNGTIWGFTAVVDERRIKMKSYMILIRRTTEPLREDLANKIIKRNVEPSAKKLGITIDSSFYVHGIYDWVICFYAEDISNAKQFCDVVLRAYTGYIADIHILETLFWVKKQGMINPNKRKLPSVLA